MIKRGHHRNNSKITCQQRLTDGAYFGEMCLINDLTLRQASVYADTVVYCYALEKRDFDYICNDYPEQRDIIYRQAQMRNEENLNKKLIHIVHDKNLAEKMCHMKSENLPTAHRNTVAKMKMYMDGN